MTVGILIMNFTKRTLQNALIVLVSIATSDVYSDMSSKRLYRYYNEKGIPTLSDQVSEEHIRRGYDIVDRNMQLIRHFPAFDEAVYNKDKVKRDAAFKQSQDDAKILRLYSSARDAELARNRLTDTLETSIGYNSLQLIRIKRLRADFVGDAALSERKSQTPSAKLKEQIADYDKKIKDLQALMDYQRAEQVKVKNEFVPIISRLLELEKTQLPTASTAPQKSAVDVTAP